MPPYKKWLPNNGNGLPLRECAFLDRINSIGIYPTPGESASEILRNELRKTFYSVLDDAKVAASFSGAGELDTMGFERYDHEESMRPNPEVEVLARVTNGRYLGTIRLLYEVDVADHHCHLNSFTVEDSNGNTSNPDGKKKTIEDLFSH